METSNSKIEIVKNSSGKNTLYIILTSIITVILIVVVIYLSQQYKKPFSVVQDIESPVARVNNIDISRKSFNLAMSGISQSIQLSNVDTTKSETQEIMRSEALNTVIEKELLVQKAKELNIVISPIQIDNEILLIKNKLDGQETYESLLSKIGITDQDMRSDIERQLLINAYEDKIYDKSKDVVSETDIRIFYEALRDKYLEQESIAPDLEIIRQKIIDKILERRQEITLENEAIKLRANAKIEVLI